MTRLEQGKQLRLSQQIFFVMHLQDMFPSSRGGGWRTAFPTPIRRSLNDTTRQSPCAELIVGCLMDSNDVDLGHRRVKLTLPPASAYTNHTLFTRGAGNLGSGNLVRASCSPPALWQSHLRNHTLSAHGSASATPANRACWRRCRLISEGGQRKVRMANRRCGRPHVNGVAELTSNWCGSSCSPSSPVSGRALHQRHQWRHAQALWIAVANPLSPACSYEAIGANWRRIWANCSAWNRSPTTPASWSAGIRARPGANSAGDTIPQDLGVFGDPSSLFRCVRLKRIHEYKRQHWPPCRSRSATCACATVRILPPRHFIFVARRPPGYAMAQQLIIRLITAIAENRQTWIPPWNGRRCRR